MANDNPWVPVGDLPTDGIEIQPAATMVLVADRPDLQVLVIKRRDSSGFVAGHTLFPGGAVEDDDRDPAWSTLAVGMTSREATATLHVPDARAFWIAAVRETIEEVGLVLGMEDQSLARYRYVLESGEVTFASLVASSGLTLDLSGLHAFSRWVTPMPSPRRYDTYFFLARAPLGAKPDPDRSETVEAKWLTPTDALEGARIGELTMMSPTFATLRRLACYSSTDQLLEAASRGSRPERVEVAGERKTLGASTSSSDGRPSGDQSVFGWTWLADPSVEIV